LVSNNTQPRRPILPPALVAKLSALGATLEHGRPDPELAGVLADMSALPADKIVRACSEIVASARLGWAPGRQSGWSPEWLKQAYLQKEPNYAWLFLFHPNGFVREAALDAINDPPSSPFFLAALAWRLNDWVRPVRAAAKRCAERVLQRASVDVAATAALYLLDRRLVWRRWRDESIVLDHVFERRDVIAAIVDKLAAEPTGHLATHLRHILRYSGIDEHLMRLAVTARQPSVRAIAYRCLISGKADWVVGFEWTWVDKVYNIRRRLPTFQTRVVESECSPSEMIRAAAHDRSAIVRRIAADALIAARPRPPDADLLIAYLAKDKSAAVRSRADYMLRHPDGDPSLPAPTL
jgi:hypothetical protein